MQLSRRQGRFYTETFFSSVPVIDMSTCCQLFCNDFGFNMVYPMRTKSEAPNALRCFIQDVGIPQTLHNDNAKELRQGNWKEICNEFMIATMYTEPHSPWQNRAEGQIRETKHHVHRKMKSTNVPKRLWSYCVKWSCDMCNKTVGSTVTPLISHHYASSISMIPYGIMIQTHFQKTRDMLGNGLVKHTR